MIKRTIILLALILLAQTALASTSSMEHVTLPFVSPEEISDLIIEQGVITYNIDNHEEVRIGDGVTAGGVRIQNSAALTNVAYNYYDDTHHNGHRIYLNSQCHLIADGAVTRLMLDDKPIWSIYAESNSVLGQVVRSELGTDGQLWVWLNTPGDLSQPPTIDYMANAPTGTWATCTTAVYDWPPLIDPFLIRLPIPTNDQSGAYRISFPTGVSTGMVMSINATL